MVYLYPALKALLSGIMIAVISEVARRSPAFAALIASLPLISVLAMIWLFHETNGDTTRIANHAFATFWYVLPSLPMFLVLPWLLKMGAGFYPALLGVLVMTSLLYLAMIFFLKTFGITL